MDTTASEATEMSPSAQAEILLKPLRLSETLTLDNRIIMSSMTRRKAGSGMLPTSMMAAYYARRADAGLVMTEATVVRADGRETPNEPGIFSDAQIEAWHRVARAVHDSGGKIFLQLWHCGRATHPTQIEGRLPVAPSAVPLTCQFPGLQDVQSVTPRALEADELPELVESFAQGAANAMGAGFDGVEIHAANGYLLDQFLHHHTNRRTDAYGGSPEGMSRFVLEVVDAVVKRVGRDRAGIRLTPGAYFNMEMHPSDPAVFVYLLARLAEIPLAYVNMSIVDDRMRFIELEGTTSEFLRRHWRGTLIGNGSYTLERAAQAIASGALNLVSLGRPFIANPDLILKVRTGQRLTSFDRSMLAGLD